MRHIDFNLLLALDSLLSEESVQLAAKRIHVTPTAMSHTLARLREVLGDPILVRAGRKLVPTPRALALRDQVHDVVEEAKAIFRSGEGSKLSEARASFVIRTQGLNLLTGGQLLSAVHARAPLVELRFIVEGGEDTGALRDGRVDLEVGSTVPTAPEIKVQDLYEDRFVGLVHKNHPLAKGKVTAARYAAAQHIFTSRLGRAHGLIDVALAEIGLQRTVSLIVPDGVSAIAIAAGSEFVASVPATLARWSQSIFDVHVFMLPIRISPLRITQAWHPRLDKDPAHRWLRDCVRELAMSNAAAATELLQAARKANSGPTS